MKKHIKFIMLAIFIVISSATTKCGGGGSNNEQDRYETVFVNDSSEGNMMYFVNQGLEGRCGYASSAMYIRVIGRAFYPFLDDIVNFGTKTLKLSSEGLYSYQMTNLCESFMKSNLSRYSGRGKVLMIEDRQPISYNVFQKLSRSLNISTSSRIGVIIGFENWQNTTTGGGHAVYGYGVKRVVGDNFNYDKNISVYVADPAGFNDPIEHIENLKKMI
ncbi:MAG: hypothetical protein ACP5QT_06205 [Brevinematia bacterium]